MKNLDISVSAQIKTLRDVAALLLNLKNNYPELCITSSKVEQKGTDLSAEFSCTLQDQYEVGEYLRLTHHAEALYEDTEMEFVHVEVRVDGKWYGMRPETRKVLVTLRRERQEGFKKEVFENNYILSVAASEYGSLQYEDKVRLAEERLRAASRHIMHSKYTAQAIYESCADFNWGDLASFPADEILKQYGLRD